MKRIVVGYDGSEHAGRAFAVAADLARRYGAELEVLCVARPPEPPGMVETEAVLEGAREHFEKAFAELKPQAEEIGIHPRLTVLVGHPADQIIHHANRTHAEMIVLGHRGRSLIQRWLLGSISRRVVSYAHCSVLIVR
jgi:nucleotide-binding universal stress UspA family protein